MSVDTESYVILGYKLPYPEYDQTITFVSEDDWEEELYEYCQQFQKDHPGFVIIIDGMGGEYTVIGKLIAKTDYQGFDEMIVINPFHSSRIFDQEFVTVKTELFTENPLIPSLWKEYCKIAPNYIIFTHYS